MPPFPRGTKERGVAELGGKQLSTLLESLPGIASVLRSPVADAIANLIRAAAGDGEFHENDVRELLQYATRRGLMGNDEADQLVEEVKGSWKKATKRGRPKPAKRPAPTPDVRIPVEQVKGVVVKSGSAPAKDSPVRRAAPRKAAVQKTSAAKPTARKAPAPKGSGGKAAARKAPAAKKADGKSTAGKPVRKTATKSKATRKPAGKAAKTVARKARRK